jgi:cytoskeletal protein RodZ
MPEIDDATEFSGSMLRQIREARGVELREMADKTKIAMAHLRAIEEEDFQNTLAPVYLRGFVKAVAQCLKLDPDRVAQSYMKRYPAQLDGGA